MRPDLDFSAIAIGTAAAVTPVIAPVAVAQTANMPTETINVASTNFPIGRNAAGQWVIIGTSDHIKGDQLVGTPTYEYDGETYEMKLERSTLNNGTPRQYNGEDTYRWVVVSKNGNTSDDCSIRYFSSGVAVRGLVDWSINGFLYSPQANEYGQFVAADVQHFADTWRIPFATGQALFNVHVDIDFPEALPAPTGPNPSVFTFGNKNPSLELDLETGGTLGVPEWTQLTPDGRFQAVPDYAFQWDQVDTGNPYLKQVRKDYVPAGSVATMQYNQPNPASDVVHRTTVTIEADKFCYIDATVPQGGVVTMDPPTNSATNASSVNTVTYGPTATTPEWATVRQNGEIVLRPGFDVEPGVYEFPVTVFYPGGRPTEVLAKVTVTPTALAPSYSDSFTHPGVKVEVNQTGEFNLPAGTNFAVVLNDAGQPKVTDAAGNTYPDWVVSVDQRTGRLSITPPEGTDHSIKYFVHVAVTTPGATQETTAGVQVADEWEIERFYIKDGQLIVVLVNGDEVELGNVVGPQGPIGADGKSPVITIGDNGNWFIDGEDTGVSAKGKDGENAAPLTIVDNTLDEDGSITLEFSDGTTVVIPAGTPGVPGKNGEDAAALTIVSSTVNENGSITLVFSDRTTVVIPAGTPGLPGEPGAPGTTPEITIGENGNWFIDGKDTGVSAEGKDGESITIVNQYINADGNTVIEFSDGTEVIVNKGVCESCGKDDDDKGSSDGSSDGSSILPGGSSNGSSILLGGSSNNGTGNGGSSDARCVQAAATVGIPLLALLPIGLATQVNIPGLSPLVADAQARLQSFNTDIQQQSGIYDPNTANFMARVNAELQKNGGVIGQAVGAAALIAVGGLVGKYLYDSCVPRG